ncbi:sodium ion-translocating decarboxylase subunit beta [Sulfurospirillum arcachonense]|uniref:sodium ion-translocating decarboxylase subunit beta n=1 Tax=Sulfurospirillum arcachonense TaxID=57666 RepID=UPI00046A6FEE|nr:sodium ion-translocating decarboxylase subunit beta [Sulfurospirillum arcachonense]
MKKLLFLLLAVYAISFTVQPLSAGENTQNKHVEITSKKVSHHQAKSISEMFSNFYRTTGIYAFLNPKDNVTNALGEPLSKFAQGWGRVIMISITFLLFYLAIAKGFEPLLLLPIAFGGLLANIPLANIIGHEGFLGVLFESGIKNELFPLIIFMGVGAMTDFGPLLAHPKTALLGAAAQFGIFASLVGAVTLSQYTSWFDFSLQDASAISIIGGADGPTSIFVASKLAPDLMGAIAVAAYSYMALVPIIQPPIMRFFTTVEERKIKMEQLREVGKMEKLLFPLTVVMLSILILPESTPLIGAFTFGNFARVSGVVDRLSDTMQNSLINIVTIFLGLAVGSKLAAEKFLVVETLGILAIGLVAFAVGTAAGVIMAKIMNKFSKTPINPLIGSAGVSAVPMAARVSNKEGMKADPTNMLLMHAMGPNVAGVIGSAVAAGVLLSIFK